MLLEINQIKVSERIRKDYGNIEELATDIRENGLINPPVVTPEYELIAGERRLRALQFLNYKQIEVRVMSVKDALHQLKLEISENENRKDFSFSEKMQWAEELKKEYEKIAKMNMSKGGQGLQNLVTLNSSESIAEEVGLGNRETYRQADYIYKNAPEEMIQKLDDGQLSINKAYITLKEEKKALEKQTEQYIKEKQVLENSYSELSRKYIEEKSKEPITVEVEVDNTDYMAIRKSEELTEKYNKILLEKNNLQTKLRLMTDKADAYEQDSSDYNKMKEDITYLTKQKDDLGRQLLAITNISGLVVEIDHLIKGKLAPVIYSKSLLEAREDEIVLRNLTDMVETIEQWCSEMRQYIPNKTDYVEVIV